MKYQKSGVKSCDAKSAIALGDMYACPESECYDIERAKELYERAIELGDKTGYIGLGRMYVTARNHEKALEMFLRGYEELSDYDRAVCAAEISRIYSAGFLVPTDPEKALEYRREAEEYYILDGFSNEAPDYAVGIEKGFKEACEDRILADDCVFYETLNSGKVEIPLVAAVCDGCGGYKGAEVAATTVLETLKDESLKITTDPRKLAGALSKCEAVLRSKQKETGFDSMCTTIAGCVFCKDKTIVFHAGDSRVYKHDGIELSRLTEDHSAPLPEDISRFKRFLLKHRKNDRISRCIGAGKLPPEITLINDPIQDGELYLICSDGLCGYLPDKKIERILRRSITLKKRVEKLIRAARRHGSRDDVSVLLLSRE